MDVQQYTDALGLVFKSFSSNTPATNFTVIGFLLLLSVIVIVIYAISVNRTLSGWYAITSAACLIFGIIFTLIGPGLAILDAHTVIAEISRRTALANLRTNERVSWVIRLIAYNPSGGRPGPNLGPLPPVVKVPQKFTFVADYQELRGYNVMDAVRMVGGQIRGFEHVEAIIFPLDQIRYHLYPANARGVLQVVQRLEDDSDPDGAKIDHKFIMTGTLSEQESADLKQLSIGTWAWDSYKRYYNHYCELTDELRKGNYDATQYINIAKDWKPLGFSLIRTERPEESQISQRICDIHSWDTVVDRYGDTFGARAFLIKNMEINSIPRTYVIHFDQPDKQVIPDIWNDVHVVGSTIKE